MCSGPGGRGRGQRAVGPRSEHRAHGSGPGPEIRGARRPGGTGSALGVARCVKPCGAPSYSKTAFYDRFY